MKRLALTTFALALAAPWLTGGQQPPAQPAPKGTRLGPHHFTLPPGFEVERVAGPPLVTSPVSADFDELGRLYVTEVSTPLTREDVQKGKKTHRVLRLESTRGDGKFDRATVFADGLPFPEGALWHAGSLYVAAPPSIWKLTDADGDGKAERRVEWFQGKTLTGCANDLHGPYLGPDGWIYWCKGAFAEQTYPRPGRKPLVTRAAHIFRARPDGSGVEPVMTGGMDNPIDVVFTPGGERIFNTTFFQFPGGGQRDGLIHAIYGGVYGKDWEVLNNHPWTGPAVMPVLTHLGAAAPAGMTRLESSAFGGEYRDNLFTALFNLRKVTRHVLEPHGATFKTQDSDFLVSDNVDFHPTDVIEDADGSLLVIDTGGWYKLCCPTSQLVKPDVPGAIYRIRKTGAPRDADPRGLKLPWATMAPGALVKLLDDARPAVRARAVAALGAAGGPAVSVLADALNPKSAVETRLQAVWALTRVEAPAARAAARAALRDPDATVRQAAIHSAAVWRDRGAAAELIGLLRARDPHHRRAAAEALGRIGDAAAVPALLEAAAADNDRALEHSLTFALIEIADPAATAAGLRSPRANTRRAALVALDQMDGGGLHVDTVAAELTADDPQLRAAAWWIAGRHPEWGAALSGFVRDRLAGDLAPAERDDLERQLARFARSPAIQQLLAERLADPRAPREARQLVLSAMARAGLREAPPSWLRAITATLDADDVALRRAAATAARALRPPKKGAEGFTAALLRVGNDARGEPGLRLAALAAVPGGLTSIGSELFDFLRAEATSDRPVATRGLAAEVLSRAKLTRPQLLALTATVRSAGPMELDRLLDAFAQSTDDAVGEALLAALRGSAAKSALSVGALRPRLGKYSAAVRKGAEALYAELDADAAKQPERLAEVLASLAPGDVRRGQAVFNGTKAACFSCHQIGYLGGKVGPDLTRIGSVRTERDLLESVLFPSASFVRGYEPVLAVTRDGQLHNGVLKSDGADEIVLTVSADKEVRIPREDLERVQPGRVSVMPAGLDAQLTRQELSDLIAFLKACR